MNRKKKTIYSLIALTVLGGSIALTSSLNDDFIFSATSVDGNYSFNFTSITNKITSSSGTINARSRDNNLIVFKYENFIPSSNCWGIVKPNGSFGNYYLESENHNQLNGLSSVTVSFSGSEYLNIGYGYYSSNQINDLIRSDVAFNFSNEKPTYFSLSNFSESNITINSVTVKYACEGSYFDLSKKEFDTYTINVKDNSLDAIKNAYSRALSMSNEELADYNQIEINLLNEECYLDETLSFSGRRNNSKDIVFNGNGKTIYGGHPLSSGGWIQYKENIFVKQIDAGLSFSNLVVDGKGADLARSNVFQGKYDNESEIFTFRKTDFANASGCSDILKGDVLVCLEERWAGCIGVSSSIEYVNSVLSSRCVYNISLKEHSSDVFFKKSRVYKDEEPYFYLANNLQLLNEENEFYYDSSNGKLYYYPTNPETINNSTFVIPTLQTLIDTTGLVDRVTFKNFTFNGSNYTYPLTYGFNESQGTVNIDVVTGVANQLPSLININSSSLNLFNCIICNSAGTGLSINERINDVNIDGCNILDSYGCGVFISKNYSNSLNNIPSNISITNCIVDGFGKMYCGAVGIIATYVLNLNISHNTICNGTYTGISAGWGWTGNSVNSAHNNYSISYNKIYNVVNSALYDGGPIYVLGGFINPQGIQVNDISYNYLEFDNGLGVIYLDEASSNWHVHHNAIKVNNKGSHWHGTIFNHNPMYTSRDYYTVSHSNHFDNNYANGCAEYKTNTYEIPAYVQYSGEQLEEYQNSHDIVIEQPILVTDPLVKEEIYYAAGKNFDGSEILKDINFAKYAISTDGNINLNNGNIEFTINGEYGFSLSDKYLQSLALSGFKCLYLKIKAESISSDKVGSIVWHAAGEVDWKLFFKDYKRCYNGIVECTLDIPLDLFRNGGFISIQARDENGASGANYRKAKYTISDVYTSRVCDLTAPTGYFECTSSCINKFSYMAYGVSYDWNRILFKDTKTMFDQGYTSVSVSIIGNKHNCYVFKGDTAIYVPENRINVDGGVYSLDIDGSGEGINILTTHEDINSRQDDEGVYGKTENMQISFVFNKNKMAFDLNNSLTFIKSLSVSKLNSQIVNGYNVDINGQFSITNYLLTKMYEYGYTTISFDVEPDSESKCVSIVTVRRVFRELDDGCTYYSDGSGGYFCYPQEFKMSNGKIHVSFSSSTYFDGYKQIDLVLRDSRGYSCATNEDIVGGMISNIVLS